VKLIGVAIRACFLRFASWSSSFTMIPCSLQRWVLLMKPFWLSVKRSTLELTVYHDLAMKQVKMRYRQFVTDLGLQFWMASRSPFLDTRMVRASFQDSGTLPFCRHISISNWMNLTPHPFAFAGLFWLARLALGTLWIGGSFGMRNGSFGSA
jgi:hypothetical protein